MLSRFWGWIHTAVCALTTEDGRKGWAMLAALGCCVVNTGIVIWAMWLVSSNPWLAFLIGLGGEATNLVVVTGLMVLLGVRRNTAVNLKDGRVIIRDEGDGPGKPLPPGWEQAAEKPQP